jgi:hypothetical protein
MADEGGRKELSFEEAQKLALELANKAFAREDFKNPYGGNIKKVVLTWITGSKEEGRWNFMSTGTAGPWANVSFGLCGEASKVKVGYAWQ